MIYVHFSVRDEDKAKKFAEAEDSYPYYDSIVDFLRNKGYECVPYKPGPFTPPTKRDVIFKLDDDTFLDDEKIRKELEKKGIETMILAFDV